jgi:phosphoglucosamine mutase
MEPLPQAYPQVLENVRVREKVKVEDIPGFSDAAREVEAALGDKGRILIRYSGTEPLLRIMLEGEFESDIKKMAKSLADIVKSEIGEA